MAKRDGASDAMRLEKPLSLMLEMARRNSGRSVGELVELASARMGVERHEAARLLYRLKELGYLRLADPSPPSSLASYFFSSHVVWFWALVLAVAAVSILVYAAPQGSPLIYLRYVFGSVFVLYLPGAALIELLYPKPSDLSQLERLALSIGLSLALVPLVGLLLNYTPWGIRLTPILTSLALLTLGLAAGAVARRYSLLRAEAAARRVRGAV